MCYLVFNTKTPISGPFAIYTIYNNTIYWLSSYLPGCCSQTLLSDYTIADKYEITSDAYHGMEISWYGTPSKNTGNGKQSLLIITDDNLRLDPICGGGIGCMTPNDTAWFVDGNNVYYNNLISNTIYYLSCFTLASY